MADDDDDVEEASEGESRVATSGIEACTARGREICRETWGRGRWNRWSECEIRRIV